MVGYFSFPDEVPSIHLFKLNNVNTKAICEIFSTSTLKIPEQRQWHDSGDFIFNLE